MNLAKLTPKTSAHLDLIRGVSALAVLFGHVRGLYFLDHRDLTGKSHFVDCLYAATGLGHQAVMVFFVLSGFFIGGSVLVTMDRWCWRRYLVSRFSRLYLVLIPALVLTAGADYIGQRLPSGPVYYNHLIPHFNTEPYAGRSSAATFAGNALFLQTITVKRFGSNDPLWSLANEFWYYMLFPVLALLLFSRNRASYKTGLLLALCALLIWLPKGFLTGFAVWSLGVSLHFLPNWDLSTRPFVKQSLTLAGACLFGVILTLSRVNRLPAAWGDLAVGGAFTVWLCLIVKLRSGNRNASPAYSRTATLVSKCSYSVYAIHFPLVLLIRTSLGTSLWVPTPRNLALGGGIAFAVFLFGLAFSRLTEAHTDAVRARLLSVLDPHRFKVAQAVSLP